MKSSQSPLSLVQIESSGLGLSPEIIQKLFPLNSELFITFWHVGLRPYTATLDNINRLTYLIFNDIRVSHA